MTEGQQRCLEQRFSGRPSRPPVDALITSHPGTTNHETDVILGGFGDYVEGSSPTQRTWTEDLKTCPFTHLYSRFLFWVTRKPIQRLRRQRSLPSFHYKWCPRTTIVSKVTDLILLLGTDVYLPRDLDRPRTKGSGTCCRRTGRSSPSVRCPLWTRKYTPTPLVY